MDFIRNNFKSVDRSQFNIQPKQSKDLQGLNKDKLSKLGLDPVKVKNEYLHKGRVSESAHSAYEGKVFVKIQTRKRRGLLRRKKTVDQVFAVSAKRFQMIRKKEKHLLSPSLIKELKIPVKDDSESMSDTVPVMVAVPSKKKSSFPGEKKMFVSPTELAKTLKLSEGVVRRAAEKGDLEGLILRAALTPDDAVQPLQKALE